MNALVLNLLVLLLELIALAVLAYLAYFFLSLPLRRRERARLFLDLVELGLRDGRSVEQTVCALGATGDRALGSRFHRFAMHLASGLPLPRPSNGCQAFSPRRSPGCSAPGTRAAICPASWPRAASGSKTTSMPS